MIRPAVPALLAASLAFFGCSGKYSRHMSETYKDAKLERKTFAVLPVMDIDYTPPSSCFGSGSGSGSEYEGPWLNAVEKDLKSTFKAHRFIVYSGAELKEMRINLPGLYTDAASEISIMGVKRYDAGPGEEKPLAYEPARPAGKVARHIAALRERDSIDYVILLVEPKMKGETQTHYNAQGGMSTSTKFTSDVQFGVWSAETGELAYSSGAISTSTGFCFFLSPQQGSINGSSRDLSVQLKQLIAKVLREGGGPAIALGGLDSDIR